MVNTYGIIPFIGIKYGVIKNIIHRNTHGGAQNVRLKYVMDLAYPDCS